MAYMYPRRPSSNTPGSEKRVFDKLRELSDDWRVFHSVSWQVPQRKRVFDGETDFVLIHPKHGMVVLEVKGGELHIDEGTWFQRDAGGSGPWRELPQSPFDQVKGAAYDLQKRIVQRVEGLFDLPTTRAVIFPDVLHPGSLGLDVPEEMIIGRDTLSDVAGAVDRLVHYAKISATLPRPVVRGIVDLLAPTTQLRPTLGTELAAMSQELVDLTDQQIAAFQQLRRFRRLLVTGGAGTGKTILAIERARRLAIDGASVLFTCYNRPLGDHLGVVLSEVQGVAAQSFHAFGRDVVLNAGFLVPSDPPRRWFDIDMPDMLPVAAERLELSFDAIVIDEGQDFDESWFTALQLLLRDPDDGPFYVFADPYQSIYRDSWESPMAMPPVELDINCRNTKPIAKKVAAVLDLDLPSLGVEGVPAVFDVAASDEAMTMLIDTNVRRMTEAEGVTPHQITLLSDSRPFVDHLRGRTIGGHRPGPLESHGLVVETIHRFKGLENDVVIVALHDITTERDRALAYIGMSRAKSLLVVIGADGVRKSIGW